MIRGALLDADGTIVNSTKTSARRFFRAALMRGHSVSRAMFKEGRDLIPRIGGEAILHFWPDEDRQAFYRSWEKVDLTYEWEPLPGARGALEALRRRHYVLSIFSNRSRRTLNPLLEKLGLSHLLTFSHGCEGGYLKPDWRSIGPLLTAYDRLAIGQRELLFVGDSVNLDWPVAEYLGLAFVGVLTGVDTRDQFLTAGVPAENIIPSVADLPAWLEKHDR